MKRQEVGASYFFGRSLPDRRSQNTYFVLPVLRDCIIIADILTVNEISDFLDGVRGHRDCDVVVRVRRPGEEPETLEITTMIVTLEKDTGDDVVIIECDLEK